MGQVMLTRRGGGSTRIMVVQAASYSALPAADNNTVGVVTAATISKVVVAPTQPTPEAGLLWLRIGYSPSKLILLSETITLSIVSASFCATTTYTRVDCFLRIAGAWKMTDYVLYNYESSDGTLALGSFYGGSMALAVSGTASKLYCSSGTNAKRAVYCTTPIDLTDATMIKAVISKTDVAAGYASTNKLAVMSVPFSTDANNATAITQLGAGSLTNATISLDVSGLIGSFYIGIQGYFEDTADYILIHDWRLLY